MKKSVNLCVFASTCKYRMAHGDQSSGCTRKTSSACDAAKLNCWFYPMNRVMPVIGVGK